MSKHEETKEQSKFVNWCKEQGLEPYAVTHDTFVCTKCPKCGWQQLGWNQINKNKALGMRRGVSDLIVFIPANRSTTGKVHILFIEMKKVKGGYASKEQIYFLSLVDQVHGDIHGSVCRGFEEAKSFIQPLIKEKEQVKDLDQFINNL